MQARDADRAPDPPRVWRLARGAGVRLDRSRILAILNVTPDSFSDGGSLPDDAAVVRRAREAFAEGADMLDIGGESTRPGAAPVPAETQAGRVVPAIRAIRAAGLALPISVDTTSALVARRALDAGASAVNDQSAGRDDPAMLALIAETSAGVILMHRPRAPRDDRYADAHPTAPDYAGAGGVVPVVRAFLKERADAALRAGVPGDRIVLDPGLGFGKSVEQNLAVLSAGAAFVAIGFPILCGASRKSFLGAITGESTPSRRVVESVGAAVAMRLGGALLFRVHDVGAHRAALAVADAAPGAPQAMIRPA